MEFSPEDDCFAVRQAARYASQMYDRHLANVGLTITQFSILCRLSRGRRLTMKQLADEMVMDRTTLVRALKPMQRDGWVVAEASEHDGRTYLFNLSKSGEQVFDQAAIAWREAQDEFESKFGKARAKALRSELFDVTAEG